MSVKKGLVLLSLGVSAVLGGCYQICPPEEGLQSQYIAPRTTDAPGAAAEQEPEVAGIRRRYGEVAYTYGEVWAVPRAADHGADNATSLVPGSNAPWTAVVYTQSAFVLAEDEPLEGKLTLRIGHDGTMSASLPNADTDGSTAQTTPHANRAGVTSSGMVGEDRPSYWWLKRFSGLSATPCESTPVTPKRGVDTDDLLRVQFMLARTPQSAGGLAVFGVQVRGNGRDFNHSQIVNGSEKTFSVEFGDVAAPANTTTVAGLRVFRISITAQRVEGHVILPSSEGQLIDATFNPQGHMLYVVNLGFVLQDDRGARPSPRTGSLSVVN